MSNISTTLTRVVNSSTESLSGRPLASSSNNLSSQIVERIKSVQFINLIGPSSSSAAASTTTATTAAAVASGRNQSLVVAGGASVSAYVGESIKIDPVVSLLTDGGGALNASFLFPPSSTSVNPDIESETHGQWSVEDAFVEGSHLWSLLVAGYSLVFAVGVIGNAILLAALCGSGSRARALPVRNHLMVNLAAADLLVTAVCVPISACAAASHACWPSFLVSWMCQLGPLLQRTPVAASTLSLALLSLDRWAALRHPRFAQRFREKRFVAMSMGCIWILASLVSAPTFWAREWDTGSSSLFSSSDYAGQNSYYNSSSTHHTSVPNENDSVNGSSGGSYWFSTSTSSSSSSWHWTGVCREQWTNTGIQLAYAATYLGTAFVSPALIVAACHASVSQKLTAQLQVLSGAAGSGDKASRRPKHVIIVARELNNASNNAVNGNGVLDNAKVSRKVVPCDPNSDEDDVFLRMQIQADLESFRQISQYQQSAGGHGNRHGLMKPYSGVRRSSPGNLKGNLPLRAARRETSIIRAHRRLRKKLTNPLKPPPPLLPTYSSQSFRSRRRAANLLAALAGVFVFCWAPYVVCALWDMFATEKSIVRLLIPFALFLGHAHSAINPVVSWRLNRSAFVRFQQQPCLTFFNECLGWCGGSGNNGGAFCTCCRCPCGHSIECDNTMSPSNTARNVATASPNQRPAIGGVGGRSSSACICCNVRGGRCFGACCSCCCSCPGFGRFRRRSSSPDGWARNSSTNEAALGAFHPKYLSRLPVPDPISKCHTSHFLK